MYVKIEWVFLCEHVCALSCVFAHVNVCRQFISIWTLCFYVSVRRCVHACVCMYVCLQMYVCMYVCRHVNGIQSHIYVGTGYSSVSMCKIGSEFAHVNVSRQVISIWTVWFWVCVFLCAEVCVYVCVCMYVYICMYVCMYVCMYEDMSLAFNHIYMLVLGTLVSMCKILFLKKIFIFCAAPHKLIIRPAKHRSRLLWF